MLPEAAGVALLIAGAAAVALLHLRHIRLLLLAVLGPLPGLAAGFVAARFFFMTGTLAQAALAWLFAFSISHLLADEIVTNVLDGASGKDAVRAAFKQRVRTLLAVTVALMISLLALAFAPGMNWLGDAVAAEVFAAVLFGVAAMWLAAFLPFDEVFVARINRTREHWHRVFDGLITVARPRWGFSVTGIAIVFIVLGVFGARGLVVAGNLEAAAPIILSGVLVAWLAAIVAAVRDWRAAVSTLGAMSVAVTVGLWCLAGQGHPLDGSALANLCLIAAAAGLPLLAAAADAGRLGRSGDDATIAASRTLMRTGPGLFFVPLSVAAGLVCAAPWFGAAGPVVAVFAGAAPLLFRPALAIVLETWIPRPATRAARYRLD